MKYIYSFKTKLIVAFISLILFLAISFTFSNIIIIKESLKNTSYSNLTTNEFIPIYHSKIIHTIVVIEISSIILAIISGIFILNRITKPLKQLFTAGKEILKGNPDPKIDTIEPDEIGDLKKAFIKLITTLKDWDIKQREESEYKLLQSEKQACIGKLAAGVAHEINNPLTGVLTFTHLLLRRKDLPDEVKSDLETIARETERVRKIVKGLLDFSRQSELDRKETNINALIKSTLKLVENQALVKGIRLKFSPCKDLPIKTLDQNQFQSVLLNMIINAFDATSPGGEVTIRTKIGPHPEKQDKEGIKIIISDTGCGIPEENLNKIFDPFFTTKEVGQGTGLGLAVSSGIIEKHGGKIFVESKVGKGSTFTIWLPIEKHTTEEHHIEE